MANSLDLDVEEPVSAIMEYCRKRVATFLRRAGRIANVKELQKIICERLNITVLEIWDDDDVTRIAENFLETGEIGTYGAIMSQLTPDTFGMLTQLDRPGPDGRVRFVAFIDCRGPKHLRRAFTFWHEIAHCLTAKEQMSLPLKRTTAEMIEKDPVEKLTDIIAGDFAFYESLFRPILEEELEREHRFTFNMVERIRDRFNPDASYASTLNACVSKAPSPIILLEAGLAWKVSEQKLIAAGLAAKADFKADLRVLRSSPNGEARGILPHIPKQMRVPKSSIIAQVHSFGHQVEAAEENLSSWSSSANGSLPAIPVLVQARMSGDHVLALIAPKA